jgi:hypothetical protein
MTYFSDTTLTNDQRCHEAAEELGGATRLKVLKTSILLIELAYRARFIFPPPPIS